MSESEAPDSVEAIRNDIEETRADLSETVNELTDRLDPKKRLAAVSSDVSDSTKQVVEHAQELTKDTAAKAQDAAKAGARRGQQALDGRERQVVVGMAILGLLVVGWRLWRQHR